MRRRDQYDELIPGGLVLLTYCEFHTAALDIEAVMEARWYEEEESTYPKPIFVSITELEDSGCSPEYLECLGENDLIEVPEGRIMRIARSLKRFSQADGFYHA